MMDLRDICEIIATYEKHGWILRRVLLASPGVGQWKDELQKLFSGAALIDSHVDAAWFSRSPANGTIAWEIRYLGAVPFALLEYLNENAPDFESGLQAVETRLGKSILAKKSA